MGKTRKNNLAIDRPSRSPENGRKCLAAHLSVALMAVIILAGGIYFASRSGSNPLIYTNDFNVYYHAAREVMAGRDPYQDSLRPSTPYLYPPLLSEVILPLALLPLPVAAYAWYLLSAASILSAAWMGAGLGCLVIQSRLAGARVSAPVPQPYDPTRLRILIAASALLILIRFILDNFDFGQVNTVVAALGVAHVYFYAKGKKIASAVALVIAVSIKLTPIILILYHLAKLRLRFVVACVGLLVAVSLLSFLPFGSRAPGMFTVFVNRTVKNGQGFDLAFSGNQSLRGAVARLTETQLQKPDMYGGESTRSPTSALMLAVSMALVALSILSASRAAGEMPA
ncbi:MAG TPA: glycosyltransferase family 87 protein, partial [Blastocatellia bacterium]